MYRLGADDPRRSERWHNIYLFLKFLAGSSGAVYSFLRVWCFFVILRCVALKYRVPAPRWVYRTTLQRGDFAGKESTTRHQVRRRGDSNAPTVNSLRSKASYHCRQIQCGKTCPRGLHATPAVAERRLMCCGARRKLCQTC